MATIQPLTFSPTSISGCQLWLDAADTSRFSLIGGNLNTWSDKSSNAYSCTPVSGNAITTASLNGQNVFFMNSTRATVPNFVWSNQYTLLTVIRPASGSFLYSQQTGSTYSNFVFTGNFDLMSVNNSIQFRDSVNAQGVPVVSSNAYSIFSIGYTSGTSASNYTVNGTIRSTTLVSGSAVSPGSNTSALWINGNFSVAGDSSFVAEIIQYNTSITNAQRQQVEGYLAWKWGLQGSLPTTHPFYYAPPNSQNLAYPVGLRIPTPLQSFSSGGAIGFDPTSVGTCRLWLNGADSSSVVLSNGVVTQWTDRSGNNNSFTIQSGGPTYSSNGVLFNRSNSDVLISASNITFATTTSFIFYVAQTSNVSGVLVNAVGFPTTLNSIRYNNGILNGTSASGGDTNDFGNGSYFVNGTFNPGFTAATYSSNHLVSAVDSTLTGSFRVTLSDTFSSRFFGGRFYEVLIYTGGLTTLQRQQIEGYLAWKWGIQSLLPSTHPYRNINPGFTILIPLPTSRALQQTNFSPRNISSCVMWLDAADPSTISLTGTSVVQWSDKSGNGNHATNTPNALRPTYSTNSFNSSYPGLVFTSTVLVPGFTTSPSNSTIMFFPNCQGASNDASYFAVWQAGDTTGRTVFNNYKNMYNIYYSLDTNQAVAIVATSYLPISFPFSATTNPVLGSLTMASGSTNVLTAGINGAVSSVSQTVTPPSPSTDNAPLGCIGAYYESYNDGGAYFGQTYRGTISEILIYTRALSTQQRQSIEGYLAWKWGLVGSLPNNHPFKRFPPPPN
jgi:hypothetical protein